MCIWKNTVSSALLSSSPFIPLRIGDENEKKGLEQLVPVKQFSNASNHIHESLRTLSLINKPMMYIMVQ